MRWQKLGRYLPLNSLLICSVLLSCNPKSTEQSTSFSISPFQNTDSTTVVLPFSSFPYYLNEDKIENFNFSAFPPLGKQQVEQFLQTYNTDFDYRVISILDFAHLNLYGLILLSAYSSEIHQPKLDFTLSLITKQGELQNSIVFASKSESKHLVITGGLLTAEGDITLEKFVYKYEQGYWEKLSSPLEIRQYHITDSVQITETGYFVNTENLLHQIENTIEL